MLNPWDVRPRRPNQKGDDTPEPIYLHVGLALTIWEMLESQLAELFDCFVCGAETRNKSNRAGFFAFTAVSSSSARTKVLEAASPRALVGSKHVEWSESFIDRVSKFGARRNEVAHGIVTSLGEHGFQLCPNNAMPTKWGLNRKDEKRGAATFQYNSTDLDHYCTEFGKLLDECKDLINAIYIERGNQDTSSSLS
jgi:hypothetical protein